MAVLHRFYCRFINTPRGIIGYHYYCFSIEKSSIHILLWSFYQIKGSLSHFLSWAIVYNLISTYSLTNSQTIISTVNVLKFWTLIACQKGLDKQCRPRSDCFWRSSLIRIFAVCYSNQHFVNSSPKTNILFESRKRKVFKNLEHLPYMHFMGCLDYMNWLPVNLKHSSCKHVFSIKAA